MNKNELSQVKKLLHSRQTKFGLPNKYDVFKEMCLWTGIYQWLENLYDNALGITLNTDKSQRGTYIQIFKDFLVDNYGIKIYFLRHLTTVMKMLCEKDEVLQWWLAVKQSEFDNLKRIKRDYEFAKSKYKKLWDLCEVHDWWDE